MKKALLLICVLSLSVISTACINNFAVQELNNKASAYMEKGDYAEAIQRLKASVDLDDSLYETHYNLAVAYAKNGDYQDAVDSYRKAINLNPDFAEAYYSLAVVEEDIITDIYSGILKVDANGNFYKPDNNEDSDGDFEYEKPARPGQTVPLSDEAKAYVDDITRDAILNYQTYLDKGKELNDRDEVEARITDLNTDLGLESE